MARPKAKHISNDRVSAPVETAFIIKKHSLREWQIIEVLIQGGMVVARHEREPDIADIVRRKLQIAVEGLK